MRFPIPFCYEANVLTATRNEVTRRYRETLDVEIPEFAAGALPVVLSWAGHHAKAEGAGDRVDALHHDGGLYEVVMRRAWQDANWVHVPVRADEAAEAVRAAMAKETHTERDRPYVTDVFVQQDIRKAFREDDPYSHKGPPKPSTVIRSYDQDRAREEAAKLVSAFVVVGGLLHRRIPEPVLVAEEKGVYATAEIGEARRCRVFRMDDLPLARERTEILGSMAAGTAPVPAFALHRPELLSRDVERMALFDATRSLLEAVRRRLATMPVPVMEAYCDLEEAFHPKRVDWDSPHPEADPAELVRLGRDLAEAARPHFHGILAVREALHGFERGSERLGLAPEAKGLAR